MAKGKVSSRASKSSASTRRIQSVLERSGGFPRPAAPQPRAVPPARTHRVSYHHPLLLDDRETSDALLEWFEGIEEARNMPWRKKWIDPEKYAGKEELGEVLAKRAYEVWVSEIMLQQTRVSTVIPYFKSWISKWPTIQDLANANHDDVLSVWKGLGYYSRATRLHQGAQAMVSKNDSVCPIPSEAEALQGFPGIGRYTAGAVSSIAFGEPEPVLDGNVARVLSRQLGLYVDVKDKKATDVLWEVADQVVKSVSRYPEVPKSKVSGNWNQGLMELGSTICTPRPKCDECPIRKTCRAYVEGEALAEKKQLDMLDIEDACSLCERLDTEDLVTVAAEEEENVAEQATKKRKAVPKVTNTISNYFVVSSPSPKPTIEIENDENAESSPTAGSKKRKAPVGAAKPKLISAYCSLFPKKAPKKSVAEEDCVVCMVELTLPTGHSKWLIEQRPAKGLLASLWQFPQSTIASAKNTPAHRKAAAQEFLTNLDAGGIDMSEATHVAELDSLVHVFSHLKLTMHVQLFRVKTDQAEGVDYTVHSAPARKWVGTDSMENETLSTGMRRCFELIATR